MTQQVDRRRGALLPHWLLGPVLAAPLLVFFVSVLRVTAPIEELPCEGMRGLLEAADVDAAGSDPSVLVVGSGRLQRWYNRSGPASPRPEFRILAAPQLTLGTVARCFERSIAHYQPATTLLVIDADEVLTDAQAALAAIKNIDEQRRYWAVSPNLILATPLMAPALGQQANQLAGFNDEVKRWAARVEGATVLDPNDLFTTQGGNVDPQLFWPDGMTLTREGYQQLQSYFLKLAGS